MKKFYSRKRMYINKYYITILGVIIIDLLLISFYGKVINDRVTNLSKLKIDEITKYYLNDTIKNYLNIDTNDYIKINYVNNSIISVDIDNNSCNGLLKKIIIDLESVVENISNGKIVNYHNLEVFKGNNGIIIFIPTGVSFSNSLFVGLGPKIPIKISFLENIEAYVDVVVENYGINNSLIKLYINISIEEILEMPINKDTSYIKYKYLLSSKLINGKVPNIMVNELLSNSSIVNSSVK